MFDWENDREQLLDEIEEMISRKRYTQLRDHLATMAARGRGAFDAGAGRRTGCRWCSVCCPRSRRRRYSWSWTPISRKCSFRAFPTPSSKRCWTSCTWTTRWISWRRCPPTWSSASCATRTRTMRKSINEILKYPEDSAGSIMTTEFVDLKAIADGGGRPQAHPPHRPGQGDHQHLLRHRRRPAPSGLPLHPHAAAGGGGRHHRRHHGHQRHLRQHPGGPGDGGP